jgi:hypothetical protein
MPIAPQPLLSDTLLPENDFQAAAGPPPVLRIVGEEKPEPLLPQPDLPVAAADPLLAVKLMSEEEKIALCS